MTREEKLKILIDSGEYDFIKNIPENELWKVFFMATFVGTDTYTVPVVHAYWRDTGSGQECSACKEIQYGYDTGRHYCPNCGAKMDGKKRK